MANLKFYRKSEAPSNPVDGYIWFDSSTNRLKIYKSNKWEDYSGKLVDATLSGNVLTITKQSGESVVLNLDVVDSKILAAFDTLDATVNTVGSGKTFDASNIPSGQHVAVQVVETNGKLTSVSLVENDIASANALSTLTGRVSANESAISALASATKFLGVKTSLPTSGSAGDIVIVGNKEYVWDASTNNVNGKAGWVELGDVTAETARIKALEDWKPGVDTDLTNLKNGTVKSIGGKTGTITLTSGSTTNGAVNFAISNDNKISGTVYGLKALAYKDSLSKSDVGLGNVTNLAATGYLTDFSIKSDNSVSITVGGTTKAITNAQLSASLSGNFDAKGAASTAESNAKSYANDLFTWVEYD